MQRVIIFSPGYNCGKYAFDNLMSVFLNMRMVCEKDVEILHIIVNDASTDDTKIYLDRFEIEQTQHSKFSRKIYHNEKNLGWLHNSELYLSPNIEDDDIIVWLDLDDWFIDANAISIILEKYQTEKCWMTYGMFKCTCGTPMVNYGYDLFPDIMSDRSYRQNGWYWQHPRTFKGFLWNGIRKSDFRNPLTNEYLRFAGDLCIGFAILEMCPPEKIIRIPHILVMYNREVANNEDKIDRAQQIKMDEYYRSMPKYEILERECHE